MSSSPVHWCHHGRPLLMMRVASPTRQVAETAESRRLLVRGSAAGTSSACIQHSHPPPMDFDRLKVPAGRHSLSVCPVARQGLAETAAMLRFLLVLALLAAPGAALARPMKA